MKYFFQDTNWHHTLVSSLNFATYTSPNPFEYYPQSLTNGCGNKTWEYNSVYLKVKIKCN